MSPHGLLFPISSKGSFICIIPTDRTTHTTAFVTLVVEHWLERDIAQWVRHEGIVNRKKGNGLFNDALNTFYLRLYDVRHGKGPFR